MQKSTKSGKNLLSAYERTYCALTGEGYIGEDGRDGESCEGARGEVRIKVERKRNKARKINTFCIYFSGLCGILCLGGAFA